MDIKDIKGRDIIIGSDIICAIRGYRDYPALRVGRVTGINPEKHQVCIYMPSIKKSVWVGNTKNRFMRLDPPQYIVGTGWKHMWSNGESSITRWVYDIQSRKIVAAQSKMVPQEDCKKAVWQTLNSVAADDLGRNIEDNIDIGTVRFGEPDEGLGLEAGTELCLLDEMPEWSKKSQSEESPAEESTMV